MTPAVIIAFPAEPLTPFENTFPQGYWRALKQGVDPLELLDAINECAHGRLPGYQGTACACHRPPVVEVPHAA